MSHIVQYPKAILSARRQIKEAAKRRPDTMSASDEYEDLADELRRMREKLARLEARIGMLEGQRERDKQERDWNVLFGEEKRREQFDDLD
jgi:predicted  nucleic acid-binding Zn-ribbon protein